MSERPDQLRAGSEHPEPGQVWDYIDHPRGSRTVGVWANDPLKITRPGRREGDWRAIRLLPKEWEKKGFEWTLYREQIAARRYRRRPDVEAELAAKRKAVSIEDQRP